MTSSALPALPAHAGPAGDFVHPFYPIVDGADALARILPAGIRLVQLRIKDRNGDDLHTELSRARALCRDAGCTLIINDHWQAAIETGCEFVHLGQEDLAEADLPAMRRAGVRLGISSHDDHELDAALAARPDYVALGPIYPTRSKQLRWSAQGLARLGHWRQRIGSLPLVAIGGITLERADAVLAAGADAIAVIGDVMNAPDPEARCRQWLQHLAGRHP